MKTLDEILAATRRLPDAEKRRLVAALKKDRDHQSKDDTLRGYVLRHWPEPAVEHGAGRPGPTDR
jgi:hypothetical protein